MSVLTKAALPVLLATSLLSGCATHSDGGAPLNQRTWPLCSLLGGLAGGGLGAIESSAWAGGGAALGAIAGGLICFARTVTRTATACSTAATAARIPRPIPR